MKGGSWILYPIGISIFLCWRISHHSTWNALVRLILRSCSRIDPCVWSRCWLRLTSRILQWLMCCWIIWNKRLIWLIGWIRNVETNICSVIWDKFNTESWQIKSAATTTTTTVTSSLIRKGWVIKISFYSSTAIVQSWRRIFIRLRVVFLWERILWDSWARRRASTSVIGGVSNVLSVTEITGAYFWGRPWRMTSIVMLDRTIKASKFISNGFNGFNLSQEFTHSFVFKGVCSKICAELPSMRLDFWKEMAMNLFSHLIWMNNSKNSRQYWLDRVDWSQESKIWSWTSHSS